MNSPRIEEQNFIVFLDLPLSGLLEGRVNYHQQEYLWHEVTVYDVKGIQQPHTFVFNLKNSNIAEAKNLNQKLNSVFEEILRSATTEKEDKDKTELGAKRDQGNQNAAQSQALPGETVMQSVVGVAPMAMAAPKPPGPLFGADAPSLAVGDFPSGVSINKPHTPLTVEVAQQVTMALTAAIQAGNVKKAQELASVLAQGHTVVNVNFDAAAQEKKAREEEISVTVHVEDRESAGLVLNDIKVKPSDTILDVKHAFLGKYGFPLEVQKWIIGNRICGDEETLSKCEVNCSGHTLYLYLLNARAVNISREDYKRQWQSHASPGAVNTPGNPAHSRPPSDYETMNFPIGAPPLVGQSTLPPGQDFTLPSPQGQGQGGAMRQQSRLSTASSSSSLAAGSFGPDLHSGVAEAGLEPGSAQRATDRRPSRGPGGTLIAPAAGTGQSVLTGSGGGGTQERQLLQGPPEIMQEQESTPQGWQCETCTLINQPTRPGCEACGSPRPTTYQVPAGCVVSEEERRRLQREQQQEAIMEQTSGQGWLHGLGQGGATNPTHHPPSSSSGTTEPLTAEQLDLILRFNDAIHDVTHNRGSIENAGSSVDQQTMTGRGASSQLTPSGVRQVVQNTRQPVQNIEYGEDVPDSFNSSLGWASEEEETTYA